MAIFDILWKVGTKKKRGQTSNLVPLLFSCLELHASPVCRCYHVASILLSGIRGKQRSLIRSGCRVARTHSACNRRIAWPTDRCSRHAGIFRSLSHIRLVSVSALPSALLLEWLAVTTSSFPTVKSRVPFSLTTTLAGETRREYPGKESPDLPSWYHLSASISA